MLTKQAKVLTDQQIKAVLRYLEGCPRNSLRNQAIFLLSLHGLRAKEIANLQICMATDAQGRIASAIALQDRASKGNSGRTVPMNRRLIQVLDEYLSPRLSCQDGYVISTERAEKFSPNAIDLLPENVATCYGGPSKGETRWRSERGTSLKRS